ncbi:MAG: aminodeoxychorismate/anthranilate synthase component II [Synergistaceae bacterium]|jgi:anthranilate synthase component 2|nr:aminodeoxychorismate/anthranilate synthase component II [Synergistaceae bacterium]
MILLIDNYDGCANNIYQLAGQVNSDIRIVRNDRLEMEDIQRMAPSHIIISGGSAAPEMAGNGMDTVRTFAGRIPILGICLGYRIICAVYGGKCTQMEKIMQGKRSLVKTEHASDLFNGVPDAFYAGFYHSWTVLEKDIPESFHIIARSEDDVVGIAHGTLAIFGLQFHPESFLSEYGEVILRNFLQMRPNGQPDSGCGVDDFKFPASS